MSVVLRLENVSKTYRLGVIGYGTLRDDIAAWWTRIRGKQSPDFNGVGEPGSQSRQSAERIAALRDVCLDVHREEIVGVIGGNGAGKSTMLKLMLGLTVPTKGRVLVRGRIGGLLEVGTGFHPELTGRENIFLSGAILGMTESEVRKRFDEIVDFSGVERFLDTPVKRYSSGMFVRLGFSIASHLEPEIMLIDEVLAVGDAEFQQKSRNKIKKLAEGGQTVVFVSHNMDAVREICQRGIVLHDGEIVWSGNAEEAARVHMERQLSADDHDLDFSFFGPLHGRVIYTSLQINDRELDGDRLVSPHLPIRFRAQGKSFENIDAFRTTIGIFHNGIRIVSLHDLEQPQPLPVCTFSSNMEIPPRFLRPGRYFVRMGGRDDTGNEWLWSHDIASFAVMDEWSSSYQERSEGLVNLELTGTRTVLDT